MANQPEKKLKCGGVIAVIWKNVAMYKGKESEYYSVSFERRYKDKDGKWQPTSSMRLVDLPDIELLSRKISEEYKLSVVTGKNGSDNAKSAPDKYEGIDEEEVL
ncbi:MAG: hypothetical protein V1859_02310 [archaeon]